MKIRFPNYQFYCVFWPGTWMTHRHSFRAGTLSCLIPLLHLQSLGSMYWSLFPRYLKNTLKNKTKMRIGSPRNPLWAGLVSKASLLREVVRESRVKGWGCPHPTRIITSTLLKEMGMPTSILLKEIWLPPKTAPKQFQKKL